jgi:RHS repeat-associated protein
VGAFKLHKAQKFTSAKGVQGFIAGTPHVYTFIAPQAEQKSMYNYYCFVLKTRQGTRRSFNIQMQKAIGSSPTPNLYTGGILVASSENFETGDATESMSGYKYRYGFNGQEKDNEIKGDGNSLDFGARIYDSRLGRWLSLDRYTNKYPGFSAYSYGLNNPIEYKDKGGNWIIDDKGNIVFCPTNPKPVFIQSPSTSFNVGKTSEKLQDKQQTQEENVVGFGYYGITGVIYTNDGQAVEVTLITDKNVYECTINVSYEALEDQNGRNVPSVPTTTTSVGGIVDGFDASTNCTGLTFTNSKFLLPSNFINQAILKSEGWDVLGVDQNPQAEDVGVSTGMRQNKLCFIHAVRYDCETEVTSKGGVELPEVQPAGTEFEGTLKYEVYRRSGTDKKVSTANDKGTANNGVRTVNKNEANEIKNAIK